ncbi:MAG: serine--tRNA ligase [Coriobacteriia bacterium]|nr:serine--tRNA ligase [Coriobacteriia bacterium]
MLDTKFIRENTEAIDAAMTARASTWDKEAFLSLDTKRRQTIGDLEALQASRNVASKRIGDLMRADADDQDTALEVDQTKESVRVINEQITSLENDLSQYESELNELVMAMPNLPDATVPIGADETENVEIRRWGTPPDFDFTPKAHWDLGPDLGVIDFERAVKLAKSRFVLLSGQGARLERALINFMLETHTARGYLEWWTPVLGNVETLTGTGQLPKFADDQFMTTDGLYLIPTAEVMLTNIHRGEVLEAEQLPLLYTAYTACFRRESGSAGRDTRGLIRVHQFDKVEMVKFSDPATSYDELELMVNDAENILQLLGLPYRVIVLCTGDLGFSAAKTYDLEVWLPSSGTYREISSCSNCTDFQARRASIKYRDSRPDGFKGTELVHTLNGSGLAVGRTMAAIFENYQTAEGTIVVPEVLRPYMGGLEVIG